MGYSQHAGVVIVADGTEAADKRLARVLVNDCASGVMRHADAGYELAVETAKRFGLPLLAGTGVLESAEHATSEADRIGSGVPKAVPYKLRHFKYMVERVRQDPISVTMLQVRGNDVMELLGIPPGPKVGLILQALFEEVLDDPAKNTREHLSGRIHDLSILSEAELKKLAEHGKERKEEAEAARDRELKEKYWVA
jgi:hypothetical protein